jgi:uroporphyrinogen-III synthase
VTFVLILRPQPGADETGRRAKALGLEAAVAPLFSIRELEWTPPDPAGFDAVMLTSANAARHGGDGMRPFLGLRCYALGEATAAAAREAGFGEIKVGPSDGAALLDLMAFEGVRRAFHPCGRDRTDLGPSPVDHVDVPVYAAEAVRRLPPEAAAALGAGARVLLHSPRAAALFAELYEGERGFVGLVAISAATAAAAGTGWKSVAVAAEPRDEALLALAAASPGT